MINMMIATIMVIMKITMIHEGDEKTEVTSISKVGRRGLGQVVTFGGLGQIHYWVRSTFSSWQWRTIRNKTCGPAKVRWESRQSGDSCAGVQGNTKYYTRKFKILHRVIQNQNYTKVQLVPIFWVQMIRWTPTVKMLHSLTGLSCTSWPGPIPIHLVSKIFQFVKQ